MGKVYRVHVELDIYWHGNNPPSAFDVSDAVAQEVDMGNVQINAHPLKSENTMKLSVSELNSYPYGDRGNEKTIEEWLKDE